MRRLGPAAALDYVPGYGAYNADGGPKARPMWTAEPLLAGLLDQQYLRMIRGR